MPWTYMLSYGRFALVLGFAMAIMAADHLAAAPLRRQSEIHTRSTETTIASKQVRDVSILIQNEDGKLRGGENNFCVLFESKESRQPLDVQDVSVDFALQVGRIREAPIKSRLAEAQPGRQCGHVNLGTQFYVPANYYVFVFFTDANHQKRKERFFVTAN